MRRFPSIKSIKKATSYHSSNWQYVAKMKLSLIFVYHISQNKAIVAINKQRYTDVIFRLQYFFAPDLTTGEPRPERPEIVAEYEKEVPEFALRL